MIVNTDSCWDQLFPFESFYLDHYTKVLPKESGVYGILVGGVAMYVGKAGNLRSRWYSFGIHHVSQRLEHIFGLENLVLGFRPAAVPDLLEQEYIRKLEPAYNKTWMQSSRKMLLTRQTLDYFKQHTQEMYALHCLGCGWAWDVKWDGSILGCPACGCHFWADIGIILQDIFRRKDAERSAKE